MKLVCDADGLIKLNKAGILTMVAQYAEIIIGHEVWHEAVTEGKARGYADAHEIERLLPQLQHKRPPAHPQATAILHDHKLGSGEREALRSFFGAQADAIVSDDRGFLSLLDAHRVPYVTPAAVVVMLAERKILHPLEQAYAALERLHPHIRDEQYQLAWKELKDLESGS